MNKIVFFDIDGTLFDTAKFLEDFRSKLSVEFKDPSLQEVNFASLSNEVKREQGYFIPSFFLDKISALSRKIDRKKLDDLFWDNSFISEHLFSDSLTVSELPHNIEVGIYSKGDETWQKRKINSLLENIKAENIYIFPDKLVSAKSVFNRYAENSILLVDNDVNVFKKIKDLFPLVNCILIDRQGNLEDNVGVQKITSLKELNNLI
jgi:hypothetical protein